MRWDLVDQFLELKKGIYARARKRFEGSEDFFREHYPGRPLVPEPLFVEMIAQTGGVLFGLGLGFQKEVILAKISRAEFFESVAPPCDFMIEAWIETEREEAAAVKGVVTRGGRNIAEAEILFAAVENLTDGRSGKIVFTDTFLDHYEIEKIAAASG